MFRKAKSVVGLDLGHQVVKAVEISMEGPEPVITGFARAEVSAGADRAEAITKVFQEGKFRSKSVVTAVSGQAVVVRYITMMQMNDAELRQAIRFESDKYLPFESDEVQIDCQRLTRKPHAPTEGAAAQEQMSVVIAACKKSAIEERIKEIAKNGLTPLAVDVDVFALANAWELCGLAEVAGEGGQERAIALVDVGASVTSINVLCGGETCFSREIGIGGQDMSQAVARRLGLENTEAEALKRDPQGREAEISRAIAPVLEDLVSELTLSLDYVENREGLRVEEILLSGGGVLAPGTVSFLEQATGRTTRTWNPLEGLRVAESRVNVQAMEACASSLAVAIGLASRACAQ
ncbi:MAG: type IV pilus assembly protein PilM [Planctomycetes bacterium]|nr:type IV pilus assembly protein PilM [Planctomycetota bacterium]